MRQPVFQFTDQASQLIRRVSYLTSLIEQKSPDLLAALSNWLLECEQLMESQNCSEQATFAALRAEVLAADRRVYLDPDPSLRSGRKRDVKVATKIVQKGTESLLSAYERKKHPLDEAEPLMRQLVLVSLQNQLIPAEWLKLPVSPPILQQIWSLFNQHDELRKGTQQVLAYISFVDALRILDIQLTRIVSGTV